MLSMQNYPGATQLEPSEDLGGSLAWLHQIAWGSNNLDGFLNSETVDRDSGTDRADVQVPLKITKLTWEREPCEDPVDPEPYLLGLCRVSSIYVREDYPALLQDIIDVAVNGSRTDRKTGERYNPFMEEMRKPPKTPGAIVMGSPGIGKSVFLIYVLVLRVLAGRSTILQWDQREFYVIIAEGVFQVPIDAAAPGRLRKYIPRGTWLLFDSNRSLTDVPPEFVNLREKFDSFIVQAASPRKFRTEWRKKTGHVVLFWMSPWSVGELIAGRQFQSREYEIKPTESQIVRFCEKYGTSANATYSFASELEEFGRLAASQLDAMSIDTIRKLLKEPTGLTMDDDLSHLLVVSRPDPLDRRQFTLDIATPFLTDSFLERVSIDDKQAALRLYWLFLTNSHTRHNAGHMLEKAFKEQFPRGGEWPVTRMKMKRGPVNNIWHADENARRCYFRLGYGGRVAEFSDTAADAPAKDSSLVYHELSSTGVVDLKPGIFIPTASNQASYDSFVFDDSNKAVVLFQVTVAPTHEILNTGLKRLPKDQIASIDLVVVTCPKMYEGARTITMKRDDTKDSKDSKKPKEPKNSKEPIKNSENINVYLLELTGA